MRDGRVGLWCAIAFFAGCVLSLQQPVEAPQDTLVDAAAVLGVSGFLSAWCLRRRWRWALSVTLLSVAFLGWAHAGHARQREAAVSVVGRLDPQPELARFEAELLESFLPPDAADADVLDRFQPDADDPPWRAQAILRCLDGSDGRHPVHGMITLVAPASAASLEAGDVVTGVGWISGVASPRNPGEADQVPSAWRHGLAGRLKMDVPPHRIQAAPWWMHLRNTMRRWVDADLCASLQPHATPEVQALVVAMTTGRRLPGYACLRSIFARTGLSHFLAISGFNVAVLFGMGVVLMELLHVPGVVRGPVLLITGGLFLALVDVEVSVLRAGMAGMLAGASLWFGRGWRGDGTLGVSALVTLVMDPWSAVHPGFQLSYAAVLALRRGTEPVDHALVRVMRSACRLAGVLEAGVVRAVRLALAASVAAWMVSTPITLACMGNASPWCAVASTMLGPLAAAITVLASVAAVLGGLPVLGWVLGAPLAWLAALFLWTVERVGEWPGCSVHTQPMDGWLAALVLAALFGAWNTCLRPAWRLASLGGAVVMLGLALRHPPPAPMLPSDGASPAFHWISLAVGDGSVHVLQAEDQAVLFDAGTISRPGVGSGVVVPALRSLGVRDLLAIVVSHPHLDHFAAIPEVVDSIPTRVVVLTEAWRGARDRPGAPAELLRWLASHGVPVEEASEGWTLRQGPVLWMAVHPPAGFRAAAVNDGSLGFLLHHDRLPGRPLALLLGDAQDAAVARYLSRRDLLRPWVMELPHHGGWRPLAQTLCEWVHPSFVMQSTGQRRFRRDRLSPSLGDATRGVTCRDGALRFTWDPDSDGSRGFLEHWTKGGWRWLEP